MAIKSLRIGIACGALLLALVLVGNARAQSRDVEAAIQFPIAELGSCGSKEACKSYCDDSAHMEACVAFAERNNLMPKDEIETAKKFIAAGAKGPGGCTGRESCESYCNDTSHIDACIAFAEEAGIMSPSELSEAKKVQAAIRNGVTPPPCGGKKACDAYCKSPENMPACITFAKQAGLMSEEDAANADKMLEAVRKGAKPPACQGKEECDAYCAEDTHIDECIEFGKAAGFISEKEAEMATKTRGKSPGGCRGKEECEAFCNAPENQETCFNFAKEHGLIPAEDLQKMEEGDKESRGNISNAPLEVLACLKEAVGEDTTTKIMNGTMRPSHEVGDKIGVCFRQFGEQQQAQQQMMQTEGSQGQLSQPPRGEQRQGEHYRPMPPEGQFARPPEGMNRPGPYEGQRPPEGAMPPEGYQMPPQSGGERVPNGEFTRPAGETGALPTTSSGEGSVPAVGTAPTLQSTPTPAPAAASEPAPAPAPMPAPTTGSAPTSLIPQTSFMAAAINFFKTLLLK